MMVLLLPYIAKLKCLEHLQLTTYNIIDDRHEEYSIPLDTNDSFKPFYTMLKSTRTLKSLDFHSTMSPGMHQLCNGLQENSTLTRLSITSFHSCNLFRLLHTIDLNRIESLYLEAFRPNELTKLCSRMFIEHNMAFEEVNVSLHKFAGKDGVTLKAIRKSDPVNLQKVGLEWYATLSINEAIDILHNLKNNCQYIIKLSVTGMLASDAATAESTALVEHCAKNSQCIIGEILAHFFLNSECTFDFSKTTYHDPTKLHSDPQMSASHDPAKLHLDPQMSFIVPFLCRSDFPEDSFLLHNNIIYTEYYSHFSSQSNYYITCRAITLIHRFEIHLQSVSELPSHLQQFPISLSSLQQIVSTQKCVEKIATHAKKCIPTTQGLEDKDKIHDFWIYMVVDVSVMKSDHVTVQNQLTWIIDSIKIKFPRVKHQNPWPIFNKTPLFPKYFKRKEEDLEEVNPDLPFLKKQHQDTMKSSPPL